MPLLPARAGRATPSRATPCAEPYAYHCASPGRECTSLQWLTTEHPAEHTAATFDATQAAGEDPANTQGTLSGTVQDPLRTNRASGWQGCGKGIGTQVYQTLTSREQGKRTKRKHASEQGHTHTSTVGLIVGLIGFQQAGTGAQQHGSREQRTGQQQETQEDGCQGDS